MICCRVLKDGFFSEEKRKNLPIRKNISYVNPVGLVDCLGSLSIKRSNVTVGLALKIYIKSYTLFVPQVITRPGKRLNDSMLYKIYYILYREISSIIK